MSLQAADKSLKPKEIPIADFSYNVMLRTASRAGTKYQHNKNLIDEDKVNIQQYSPLLWLITTFNVLFRNTSNVVWEKEVPMSRLKQNMRKIILYMAGLLF